MYSERTKPTGYLHQLIIFKFRLYTQIISFDEVLLRFLLNYFLFHEQTRTLTQTSNLEYDNMLQNVDRKSQICWRVRKRVPERLKILNFVDARKGIMSVKFLELYM